MTAGFECGRSHGMFLHQLMYTAGLIWLHIWAYRLRSMIMSVAVRPGKIGFVSHVLMSHFSALQSKKTTRTCDPGKHVACSKSHRTISIGGLALLYSSTMDLK